MERRRAEFLLSTMLQRIPTPVLASSVQGGSMGKKVSVRITVAPADWQAKREELEKKKNSDGARNQLRAGWLKWLGEATCQTASARVAPASLATPVIDDDT
jgi:hypothetical protein